eukprot:5647167-Prorocentrum_lima.AAC.1
MHDEGFKIVDTFLSDDDATIPHTLISRVHSTYPQEIIMKKFQTVEQGMAWVSQYMTYIRDRLIRIYGG